MKIEDNENEFYIAVARDGTEYFSEDLIKKVEEYINNEHEGSKRYNSFITEWNENVWGDFYSFINYSDYGHFYGEDLMDDWLITLPKGTIESATGVKLSYKDGVKRIKIKSVHPIGIKWEILED